MRPLLLVITLLTSLSGLSQIILSESQFLKRVADHHPLAMNAALLPEMAGARRLQAQGAFDPKIAVSQAGKEYKEKTYYDISQVGLKIPTRFGPGFEVGYNDNSGEFMNPERSTPGAGLWNAGISIPIGAGLFTDQQRTALKQADIALSMSEQEKYIALNELFLRAGEAYWDWALAYYTHGILEESIRIAELRLANMISGADLGDNPYIDTVEAGIQLRNRLLTFSQVGMQLENAAIRLEVFLWNDGLLPLELDSGTVPESIIPRLPLEATVPISTDQLTDSHRALALTAYKIQSLELENRLKREMLKPQLNLKHNLLSAGNEIGETENILADYNYGIEFSMPLFLRKERGAVRESELKIREQRNMLAFKETEIEAKSSQALNSWVNMAEQSGIAERISGEYKILLDGEQELFDRGESSLFLLNRREMGYFTAQLKEVETKAKSRLSELKTYYALVVLPEFVD